MTTIQPITREQALEVFGPNGENWVQGWGEYGPGVDQPRTCWRGMIRHCSPQPGDGYLIEQVEIRRGFGDEWNDRYDTEFADILEHLNGGIEVTDEDLAGTFGTQWREIVALVRRAAVLTAAEAKLLAAAWDAARASARAAAGDAAWAATGDAAWAAARDAARASAWAAAWAAARDAARASARDAAWAAAGDAARAATGDTTGDTTGDAAWDAARDAAWDAAWALVVRALIGQYGFAQEHYGTLTAPWREVIGPVHPEDGARDGGAQ